MNEGDLSGNSYEEKTSAELDSLLIRQKEVKKEIRRIDGILSGNKKLKNYIEEMKLSIKAPDGKIIQVTKDNIVGLNDSIDFLIAKRKNESRKLVEINNKISSIQRESNNEEEQLSFFESASQIEVFDKRIARIPLNQIAIKKEISRLEKEIKNIKEELSKITRINSNVLKEIYDTVVHYAEELEIGDKTTIQTKYIFTSNLKELSGAILHKTVFAFRLGYILAIEKKLNIKLPIILDSPKGKEIDQNNITIMMNILKRDFADHQIIIASIFEYDFDNINKIIIKDRLIDEPINQQ